MTDEELAAIKARADAATRGPWEWRTLEDRRRIFGGEHWDLGGKQLWPAGETRSEIPVYEGWDFDTVMAMPDRERLKQMPGYVLAAEANGWEVDETEVDIGDPDADFIAHARTDVTALVAEVERLREALGEIASFPCPACEGLRPHAAYYWCAVEIARKALATDREERDG